MLQTANCMISYLLKTLLVQLVETETLLIEPVETRKRNILHSFTPFTPFTRTKILVNGYLPLLYSLKALIQTKIQSIMYNHAKKQRHKHSKNAHNKYNKQINTI